MARNQDSNSVRKVTEILAQGSGKFIVLENVVNEAHAVGTRSGSCLRIICSPPEVFETRRMPERDTVLNAQCHK